MKDAAPNATDVPSFRGTRTGLETEDIKQAFLDNLFYGMGRANVEIREEVGKDNFFLFGLTVEQVTELRTHGYRPRDYYEQNPILREVLDLTGSGALSNGDKELFRPIVDNLLEHDPFFLLADYQSYVDCQGQVSALWTDDQNWTRKSILNVARMGKFSADRSIDDYCERIWKVKPVHVHVG